jgi:hypothetical protein
MPMLTPGTKGRRGLIRDMASLRLEDDPIQSADLDYRDGANEDSLNEARKKWASLSGSE